MQFDPATDFGLLLAVPLIPLAGYVVGIFFGRRLPRGGDWLLTGGMFVSMCITVLMFFKALAGSGGGERFFHDSADHGLVFKWFFQTFEGAPNVVAGILYDPLGAALLMVVGVVSFCVHLFSTGYMAGTRRYHIFFSNISLFTFAMLALVLSNNILFFFIFWEIMGLMSYLLIGHFAHDPTDRFFQNWATWASKKAFLTTRVGDVLLLIGILIFYDHFGTFRFTELWEAARQTVAANGGEHPAWMTAAGLCIAGGTIGKSAQFPLHIWLPDAMAGPTPVSAMIHAATMVAAGVFLLGRTFPLLSPEALAVIAVLGAFTALFAATMGTTAHDLKAVLAYSTISQLGFMVAAVGCGAVVAGMFHMVTHAFFKACLFLSAGSVIHGCHHEQDMRAMGGLRRKMPITFACMLVCTLAISGVPLFSGFYSKDKIIAGAFEANMAHFSGYTAFASLALPIAALLTTFYMFRLVYMTFFGSYGERHAELAVARRTMQPWDYPGGTHGHGDHETHDHGHDHAYEAHEHGVHAHEGHGPAVPHESPPRMWLPLAILAFLGIFGGHFWLAHPTDLLGGHGTWFERLVSLESMYGAEVGAWLDHGYSEEILHAGHAWAVGVSLLVVVIGIGLATWLYVFRKDLPRRISRGLGLAYETVRDHYYVDEVVDRVLIQPVVGLAKVLRRVDELVVDGFVLLVGSVNRALGFAHAWFDRTVVDGLVELVGQVSQVFGAVIRLLQTGRIQQYAAFAVGGGMLLAAWLILS